jgi:hypothetical protein
MPVLYSMRRPTGRAYAGKAKTPALPAPRASARKNSYRRYRQGIRQSQLGIMYLLAFRAYLYLTVSEFLLFTVFTPLYITQERQKHQRCQPHAHQHGKIAIDATGKVFANQAKSSIC